MVKKKISPEQKKSSKNTSNNKLKLKLGVRPYSPTREILHGDLIGKAILECLKNNDPEGVMEVIGIYLNTVNRVKTAQQASLSRSTLYKSLKHKNPTIKTLAKIISTQSSDGVRKTKY